MDAHFLYVAKATSTISYILNALNSFTFIKIIPMIFLWVC